MKSSLHQAQEDLAQWRGSLVIPPPHPDAPQSEPPPVARRLSEKQRAEQSLRRAYWRIAQSRLSPAARERKRIRDKARMRKKRYAKSGVPVLEGERLRENRLQRLDLANEVLRLLKLGLNPRDRLVTGRKRPYSRRWKVRVNAPAPRVSKGMPTAASPFLARMQREAEERDRKAAKDK